MIRAITARQDVHHHDVGMTGAGDRSGLAAVGSLADKIGRMA
jgi:hypothetical protein